MRTRLYILSALVIAVVAVGLVGAQYGMLNLTASGTSLTTAGNLTVTGTHTSNRLNIDAATTYLDVDGSNNMTLTDAVTGTKTLAQLAQDTTYTAGDALGLTAGDFDVKVKTGGGIAVDTDELTLTSTHLTGDIGITIDGAGTEISDGVKGFVRIPYACTITGVYLMADQSGSCVVDVWLDDFASYPPTIADTITASAKPTLSTAASGSDVTLTDWSKTVAAGDVIGFNVDSCTTITRLTLQLTVTK